MVGRTSRSASNDGKLAFETLGGDIIGLSKFYGMYHGYAAYSSIQGRSTCTTPTACAIPVARGTLDFFKL